MHWEHSSLQDICVYIKMADHDGNHRCLIEKNVPTAFILSSRWPDCAESLGMETTSCLYISGKNQSTLIYKNILFFSVGNYGHGWHTAEGDISSAYRSFSNEKIFGRMGIYIGLSQVTGP